MAAGAFALAAGPHPRRVLTLMPRSGITGLRSAWPQALFALAAGPHPRRVLTLMPRSGITGLRSAWPQALSALAAPSRPRRDPARSPRLGFTVLGSGWPQALLHWRRGPTPALPDSERDLLCGDRSRQAIAHSDFELVLARREGRQRHRLAGERLRFPRRRLRQIVVGHVLRRRAVEQLARTVHLMKEVVLRSQISIRRAVVADLEDDRQDVPGGERPRLHRHDFRLAARVRMLHLPLGRERRLQRVDRVDENQAAERQP